MGASARADVTVRPVRDDDRDWVGALLAERWGSAAVVTRGHVHEAEALPGFIAIRRDERLGLATFHLNRRRCELVTLDSLAERQGIGTALVDAVASAARAAGCDTLWLITTNDNTPALRFYQRRGFRLVAAHIGAIDEARRLKPEIPLVGLDGILIRDELELRRPV